MTKNHITSETFKKKTLIKSMVQDSIIQRSKLQTIMHQAFERSLRIKIIKTLVVIFSYFVAGSYFYES
jgi:hypothetical protein